MKFSFKKIGSVLASTAMLSSTVALAAAANFPEPFVTSAGADVAIVHGGVNAAYTDLVAVADITSHLASELASKTAKGGTSTKDTVVGEAAQLFTSGTKLYLNDTLNQIKSVLTETQLPIVLKETSFSGNVDANVDHSIIIGSNPQPIYAKEPTSSFDPDIGLQYSSTQANYLYNATATFSKTINFSHADSKGEDLNLFGQKFTISSATTSSDLVLLKSAERVSLTNEDPSKEVVIEGKTYTVELVSTSDTSATVKVTNSAGVSTSKEISENASKKVGDITIAVINSDENNLLLSATLVVGAEKVTLTNANQVKVGDDNTVVDGTLVTFPSGQTGNMTKIEISVYAPTSDKDFLRPGESFVDPVFGTFKVDFPSISMPVDSTAREDIKIAHSGDDKMTVTFSDHRNKESTAIQWARNATASLSLQKDSDGRNISVLENEQTFDEEYIVLGNEDHGYLLRVSSITNQSNAATDDKVSFIDVISGETYTTQTASAEGTATLILDHSYTVSYFGASNAAESAKYIKVNYPDSTGQNAVIYPTIQTSKGSKLFFYEPKTINMSDWDGADTNLAGLKVPDGDAYLTASAGDITFANIGNTNDTSGVFNVTCASTTTQIGSTVGAGIAGSVTCTVGRLTYNITASSINHTQVFIQSPQGGNINAPAIGIFEEKDDNSNYEAMMITIENGNSADDGIGVDDIIRTWSLDGVWDQIALNSNSKIQKEADLWGTLITRDTSDSDQVTATISYPDEQMYANVYVSEIAASITGTGSVSGATVSNLGSVAVTDSETSSVSGKNLIVVGGSCVNSVAAELLGVSSPTCGADFTTKTGVSSDQYLIETFARTGGKVATLVAGFNAGDTTNAAKALTTQTIDTTAGKKYTGTTSTDVTAVVAAA